MAQGDISTGDFVAAISADSFVCDFTSGPRAGERWRVRSSLADAAEEAGPDRFEGQGALAITRAWLDANGGVVILQEDGRDQWGRLVGFLRGGVTGEELGSELIGAGFSQTASRTTVGNTLFLDWPTRRAGAGIGGPLEVDLLSP